MTEIKLTELLFVGLAAVAFWLVRTIWNNNNSDIAALHKRIDDTFSDVEEQIRELERRVLQLEKADAGVQVHLSSLIELKNQINSLRTALLGLHGFVDRRKDGE